MGAAGARRVPAVAPALLLLVVLSMILRSTALDAAYWIDEGLSVGIARHDLLDIPGVLRQDGSPPLYYLLLHLWTALVGDGEWATRVLSLGIALMTVPVAWVAGRAVGGARVGWAAAAIAAVHPFLTYYAQETRMYALVVLLSLVAAALAVMVVVDGRRGARVPLGVVLAALLLTHSWGLFLAAGLAVAAGGDAIAWRGERGRVLRDGGFVLGVAGVLYAAWVPTLVDQVRHTGAPWSDTPGAGDLLDVLLVALGGTAAAIALGAVALVALATARTARPPSELREAVGHIHPPSREVRGVGRGDGRAARLAWMLAAPPVVAVMLAFMASQVEPAWATRYVAVAVGPLILLAALAVARAGVVGLAGLAVVVILGLTSPQTDRLETKDGLPAVAARLPRLGPGDLVISGHPERGPLARHEIGPAPRYADLLGRVEDPQVFDWRDALDRLRAAEPQRLVDGLVTSVAPGHRIVLFVPEIGVGRWTAPWTSLVAERAFEWSELLLTDSRLRDEAVIPPPGTYPQARGVRAWVYVRR